MRIINIVEEQYRKFSKAEGNDFIASEYALLSILKLIERFKSKIILDDGVGIGTISDSILRANFDFRPELYGIETNDYCLDQISKNVDAADKKLKIFANISDLPSNKIFDLVIVDGIEDSLDKVADKVSARALIVVEGDRKTQVTKLRSLFPNHKYAALVSVRKNSVYSKRNLNEFKGGIKLIFVNPNLRQYLFWIKIKILMKFKYFRRDYLL